MKKLLLCFLFVGLILAVSLPAVAGSIDTTDQITLSNSQVSSITFAPTTPGNFNMVFGKGAIGTTLGTGIFSPLVAAGGATGAFYTILQNGATVSSAGVSTCGGLTCILLSQTKNLVFDLGSTKGGSQLLTGFLTLLDIAQSGNTGTTNNNLVVDLTITGGSLASKFAGLGAVVQLTLNLKGLNIFNLTTVGHAQISTGSVNPLLSEPSSLSMLGLGLISLAGVIRRNVSSLFAKMN